VCAFVCTTCVQVMAGRGAQNDTNTSTRPGRAEPSPTHRTIYLAPSSVETQVARPPRRVIASPASRLSRAIAASSPADSTPSTVMRRARVAIEGLTPSTVEFRLSMASAASASDLQIREKFKIVRV
jgi:hypothetical protein